MIVTDLDRFIVAAWQAGALAGTRLRYNQRKEQMFVRYPDGSIVEIELVKKTIGPAGDSYEEYTPARPIPGGFDAIAHTHQDRRRNTASLSSRDGNEPYPGPRDGITPWRLRIPNYGLSSIGVWVVRPGPSLTVALLAGRWGSGFNLQSYAAALNQGRGDINAAGRRVRDR